jgi:hypothetical protein
VPLTAKAELFAKLIASGETKVDAYNQVYRWHGGTRRTRTGAAHVLSRQPAVAERIAFYQSQILPIDDLRMCQQRMLMNLQVLAFEAPDAKVRLAASKTLFDLCEEQLRNKIPGQAPADLEELIEEILSFASAPDTGAE